MSQFVDLMPCLYLHKVIIASLNYVLAISNRP